MITFRPIPKLTLVWFKVKFPLINTICDESKSAKHNLRYIQFDEFTIFWL